MATYEPRRVGLKWKIVSIECGIEIDVMPNITFWSELTASVICISIYDQIYAAREKVLKWAIEDIVDNNKNGNKIIDNTEWLKKFRIN